jgi:hypothetical protein
MIQHTTVCIFTVYSMYHNVWYVCNTVCTTTMYEHIIHCTVCSINTYVSFVIFVITMYNKNYNVHTVNLAQSSVLLCKEITLSILIERFKNF